MLIAPLRFCSWRPRYIRISELPLPIPIVPTVIASAIVALAIVTPPVVTASVISASVVAVVVSITPVGWVIPAIICEFRIKTVVDIRIVITGSVKDRKWNGKSKGKVNAGARRRFREERQSSDRNNEDNELLHKKVIRKRREECTTNSRNR